MSSLSCSKLALSVLLTATFVACGSSNPGDNGGDVDLSGEDDAAVAHQPGSDGPRRTDASVTPHDMAVPPGGKDAGPPPPPDSVQVIIEPSDNGAALLKAIQGAHTSIHMTMYLLDDSRFINALIAQSRARLDVKVMLNQAMTTTNQTAFNQLKTGGVSVAWAPAGFSLTHEKSVLLDGTTAWVMTMNLEVSSPKNREYLAIDTAAADVQEAEALFAADFANVPSTPTGNLLVAPVNARARLLALIQSATTSVDLEGEELSDYMIVNALAAAQGKGIPVRAVLANTAPSMNQQMAVQQLKTAGVKLVSLGNPYVHAKALVVDGARAYVGSANFTGGSLQYNRELSLITNNAASVSAIARTISLDFGNGTPL